MKSVPAILLVLAACGGDIDGPGMGPGDGSTPGVDSSNSGGGDAHAFCVSETNRYRAMKTRPALTRSTQLETYADQGAMVDFSSAPHNHFSQTGGGGIAFA